MTEFICDHCDAMCVLDVDDENPELPVCCPYTGQAVFWERIREESGEC